MPQRRARRKRKAKACHSADADVRAACEENEYQAIKKRRPRGGKKLSKRAREKQAGNAAREARVNIARRSKELGVALKDRQGRKYAALVRPDGSKNEGLLTQLDAAVQDVSNLSKRKYVDACTHLKRSSTSSSTSSAYCFGEDVFMTLPASGVNAERTITVKVVLSVDPLSDEDAEHLFKVTVTPRLMGLTPRRRSGAAPQLPKGMVGGVLPAEGWAPGLLGFNELGPDDSFVLFSQGDPSDEPRFVCAVLRNALTTHKSLVAAATLSSAGIPCDWYLWNKGCGASGFPTARTLRALLDIDASLALRYFGNSKCTYTSALEFEMRAHSISPKRPPVSSTQPLPPICTSLALPLGIYTSSTGKSSRLLYFNFEGVTYSYQLGGGFFFSGGGGAHTGFGSTCETCIAGPVRLSVSNASDGFRYVSLTWHTVHSSVVHQCRDAHAHGGASM